MPNQHFRTTRDALAYLEHDYPDFSLVGMETTESSVEYTQMEYPPAGIVLILGNEVTGVDPDILTELDSIVEIPMFGTKNSLNVAACAPGKKCRVALFIFPALTATATLRQVCNASC